MLKSEIVPIVPQRLKTPLECLSANTFPHGKRTICLGVFTVRHQKNYGSQQRKFFEANRKNSEANCLTIIANSFVAVGNKINEK